MDSLEKFINNVKLYFEEILYIDDTDAKAPNFVEILRRSKYVVCGIAILSAILSIIWTLFAASNPANKDVTFLGCVFVGIILTLVIFIVGSGVYSYYIQDKIRRRILLNQMRIKKEAEEAERKAEEARRLAEMEEEQRKFEAMSTEQQQVVLKQKELEIIQQHHEEMLEVQRQTAQQQLEIQNAQLDMQKKQVELQQKQMNAMVKCPKCGSTSISGNKKGYGIGKGIIGASAVGAIGLVAGNLGSQTVYCTCMKCGHRFKAGKRK